MAKATYDTVDEYIRDHPANVRERLETIRRIVHEEAPEATEKISYAIPTFYLNGNLVHFAGYASHIGFYPTPRGIAEFETDLSRFKQGKGSVQFPLDEPLPEDLIRRIVRFRVAGNARKSKKV